MSKILSSSKTIKEDGNKEKFFAVLTLAIPILVGIYLFFNPFPHTTAIKELCFYTSLLCLTALMIFRKTDFSLRSPLSVHFLLFFLWAVFGLFFALDLTNSIHDLKAHFLKYVIIYLLIVNYFHTLKRLEILSWIIIASATVFSLYAIIHFYFVAGYPFSERLGVALPIVPTNYIGFLLIFALTLAINKLFNNKTFIIASLLLVSSFIICLTTLLTQSRGSFLALFIALIILSLRNRKILTFLIIVMLLVIIIPGFKERFTQQTKLHNDRVKVNALTMEVIKSYPLTGIGFGMEIYGNAKLVDLQKFDRKLPEKYQGGVEGTYIACPHNTILDVTVRTGIMGLVFFLGVVLTPFWMIWKTWTAAKDDYFKSWTICILTAFASFMAAALLADTSFGLQAVVFYTILAIITILWNLTRENKSANSAA